MRNTFPFHPQENEPDYGGGFLRVPLSVWYALYCKGGRPAPFTRRQLQLVSVVLRETWGWSRPGGGVRLWSRPMTPGAFAATTGLSTDRLSRDLEELISRGVLRERDGSYQFVPYPQVWGPKPSTGRKPPSMRRNESDEASPVRETHRKRKDNEKKRFAGYPLNDGDNFPVEWENGEYSAPKVTLPDGSPPLPSEKFVEMLVVLAGGLSPEEERVLREWIEKEGVAEVWHSLEASLIKDHLTLQEDLRSRLKDSPSPLSGESNIKFPDRPRYEE